MNLVIKSKVFSGGFKELAERKPPVAVASDADEVLGRLAEENR